MLNSSTPPDEMRSRLEMVKEDKGRILRVKHWRAIPEYRSEMTSLTREERALTASLMQAGFAVAPRPPEFKVGDQVTHEKWGRGEVIAVIRYPRVTFYDVRYANGDVHSHPGRQLVKVEVQP